MGQELVRYLAQPAVQHRGGFRRFRSRDLAHDRPDRIHVLVEQRDGNPSRVLGVLDEPAQAFGNAGDVRPIGEGISELRIHHGPGYRVYYVQRGAILIILLCGGDKSTQTRDIETAKRLAKEIE